jgi:transcriptional regulator with GAF, ATPase, and Fis domain
VQRAGAGSELASLTLVLAQGVVGAGEAPRLADEVVAFVARELGLDYAWPGNVRELEQCVRSVLVRGEYRPPPPAADEEADVAAALREGTLGADELLSRYVTGVYARAGSYEETARRLGLDRRTVKARVDRALLARLRRP